MGLGNNDFPEWWQNRTVEEVRGRYFGLYLGLVKDRNDPKKLGRVRIYCPSLMPGNNPNQSSAWLPWAIPAGGGLSLPPLDSPVSVLFEQGQIQNPVYFWGWIKGNDATSSEAPVAGKGDQDPTWKGDQRADASGTGPAFGATVTADTAKETPPVYGFNKVFTSEGGHTVEMDDSPGKARVRYSHPSGTSILIDPDGSVHIRAAGAIYNEPVGDYVINLTAGGQFKVVYPGGTSVTVGASGFYVTGHAATIMSRFIRNNGEPI